MYPASRTLFHQSKIRMITNRLAAQSQQINAVRDNTLILFSAIGILQ